jgi:hypothetical protein
VLRTEGLIYSRQGKGTFVREHRPIRRIASERYRLDLAQIKRHGVPEPPKGTSFTIYPGCLPPTNAAHLTSRKEYLY